MILFDGAHLLPRRGVVEARGEVVLSAAWGSGGWIWLVGARGEVRLAGEESSNILGGEWKVCGRGDRKCRLI